MVGTYIPAIPPQYFDNNGDPASGYKLFTYASGTTTKLATYTDADLAVANANPIVLDAAGRATIFLSANTYKFVLALPTDTDPPLSPVWTRDEVAALAAFNVNVDIAATAGELISGNEICYLSQGVGSLDAGRWYRADATNDYSSVYAPLLGYPTANIAAGATGTIRIMGRVDTLGALVTGTRYFVSSTTPGSLTTSELAKMRLVGYADSTSSLILTPSPVQKRAINVTIGAPGAGVLTSGVKHYLWLPFPFLVTGWTITAEQSGSVVVDVWSDTYANFPPTVADTIAGSEKPTLTAAQKNQDLNLSTWTNLIPRDNVIAFKIDSVATVNYVSITLEGLVV